jgi:hypothetical protein
MVAGDNTTSVVDATFEDIEEDVAVKMNALLPTSWYRGDGVTIIGETKENPNFTDADSITTTTTWPTDAGWEVEGSSFRTDASGNQCKPFMVFDKITSGGASGWFSLNLPTDQSPEWVRIKYPNTTVINAYSITSRDIAGDFIRFPAKWKMQGSYNLSSWVDLEDYRTETSWNRNTTKNYTTNINTSNTPYLYYRLLIKRAQMGNTNTADGEVFIGEWRLFTKDVSISNVATGTNLAGGNLINSNFAVIPKTLVQPPHLLTSSATSLLTSRRVVPSPYNSKCAVSMGVYIPSASIATSTSYQIATVANGTATTNTGNFRVGVNTAKQIVLFSGTDSGASPTVFDFTAYYDKWVHLVAEYDSSKVTTKTQYALYINACCKHPCHSRQSIPRSRTR